jgi:hypothetical protein
MKKKSVYSESPEGHINTLGGKCGAFFNVKACGTYSNDCCTVAGSQLTTAERLAGFYARAVSPFHGHGTGKVRHRGGHQGSVTELQKQQNINETYELRQSSGLTLKLTAAITLRGKS